MKQVPLYSLVVFPPPEQIALVKSYKELLRSAIGWFGSVNAKAHITIIQFDNEMMLSLYIDQIREFCKLTLAKSVRFNSWGSFEPHTFFIAPEEATKNYLDTLIKNLHQDLGFKIENPNAHISIARRLDAAKMMKAYELFQNIEVDLQFECDAIYVRKFDGRQYSEIIEKIDFGK